jgi:hypothetical protein
VPKARQHIPDVEELKGVQPQMSQYSCVEQLLELPWVTRWLDVEEFHRFCRSDRGDLLMVENEDGTWWMVAAVVTPTTIDTLPVVQCKKAQTIEPEEKG